LSDKPVDALYHEMGDSAMIFRVRWWIESYADTRQAIDQVRGDRVPVPDTECKPGAGAGGAGLTALPAPGVGAEESRLSEAKPTQGLEPLEQPVARSEEEERWREAERRRLIAESLWDVLAALNSDQPLPQILGLIADQARRLLDTQAVGIYRLEREADRWAVEAVRGLLVTYVAGSDVPIGQSTLRQAILSRRPLVGSPASDPDLQRQDQAETRLRLGWYRAWLAVPIVIKDKTYGGMLLYYTEPRALSEEEIQLATSFCDQAALAIENAQLRPVGGASSRGCRAGTVGPRFARRCDPNTLFGQRDR